MSRTVGTKNKIKFTTITKEHLERAKKVMYVHTIDRGNKVEFLPITISKKDLKEWKEKMNEGLVLKGNMFETGFLPLSIFVFRTEYKEGRIA